MFKKILGKVLHSVEQSKHGGHRSHSSSHRGRPVSKRHSSSDARRGGTGHKYYKNRYGSSS